MYYTTEILQKMANNTLLTLLGSLQIEHQYSTFPLTWTPEERNEVISLIVSSEDDHAKNTKVKVEIEAEEKLVETIIPVVPIKRAGESAEEIYNNLKGIPVNLNVNKLLKKGLSSWTVKDLETAKKILKL